MQKMRTAAIVLVSILAVPVAGFAAAATDSKTKSTSSSASHTTEGVVKSIDSSNLIIEHGSGKKRKEMTFALDTTTRREGDINVGSTVEVRYHGNASKLMALDVKTKTAAKKTAAH